MCERLKVMMFETFTWKWKTKILPSIKREGNKVCCLVENMSKETDELLNLYDAIAKIKPLRFTLWLHCWAIEQLVCWLRPSWWIGALFLLWSSHVTIIFHCFFFKFKILFSVEGKYVLIVFSKCHMFSFLFSKHAKTLTGGLGGNASPFTLLSSSLFPAWSPGTPAPPRRSSVGGVPPGAPRITCHVYSAVNSSYDYCFISDNVAIAWHLSNGI